MDGTVKRDLQAAAATTTSETGTTFLGLPDYLVDTYSWAYLRPTSLLVFDNPWVVNTILWGNFRRLVRLACEEFKAGDRVLQAASVYGNLSASLAEKVGRKGQLEVIDIAPLQVEHCRRKLANYPQARVRVADAAAPGVDGMDAVCCFFLLHEVPDWHKRAVVDALLASIRPGGKVVFVDYHNPMTFHPVRPIMQAVFHWLEPFAAGLLGREIKDFAKSADRFEWRKEMFFGGLYQKVIAVRHPESSSPSGE